MKRFAAGLMLALAVAGTAVAPVQAQRLGLFFGDERGDFYPERITCLSDHEIRRTIADRGYRDIYLNVAMDKHIEVRATQGNWVYLLDFNYCSAQIESRTRLRPAR